jgi:hypothetical protein
MNSVLSLFQETKIKAQADVEGQLTIAITHIIALNAQLIRRVKELSKHPDAVDEVAESLNERSARERLMRSSRVSRESLAQSVRELSYQLRKLPASAERTRSRFRIHGAIAPPCSPGFERRGRQRRLPYWFLWLNRSPAMNLWLTHGRQRLGDQFTFDAPPSNRCLYPCSVIHFGAP